MRDYDAAIRFFVDVSPRRDEPYGPLAVFLDLEGNRWDLLGQAPEDRRQAVEAGHNVPGIFNEFQRSGISTREP